MNTIQKRSWIVSVNHLILGKIQDNIAQIFPITGPRRSTTGYALYHGKLAWYINLPPGLQSDHFSSICCSGETWVPPWILLLSSGRTKFSDITRSLHTFSLKPVLMGHTIFTKDISYTKLYMIVSMVALNFEINGVTRWSCNSCLIKMIL